MLNATTFSSLTSNHSTISTSQCEIEKSSKFIVQLPLPFIAAFVNIVVWLAATFYKNTLLRQNNVYLCVTSTLLSNLGLLALHIWEIFGSINHVNSDTARVLWAVCQAGASSMLFVMSWNLCALIYVMLDSTYFHSSSRASYDGVGSEAKKTEQILTYKRRVALLLIAFAWLVPLLFAVFAVLFWNCSYGITLKKDAQCQCPLGAVDVQCPTTADCSRVFPPLKNGYWAGNAVLWLIEVCALLWFTHHEVKNFEKFTGRGSRAITNTDDVSEAKRQIPHDVSTVEDNNDDHTQHTTKQRSNVFKSWIIWNPRLKLATLLTSLFVIGTAPAVVVFIVDVTVDEFSIFAAHIAANIFLHIYTLVCPILLVSYLPNLRTALKRLCSAFLCCFS